MRFIREYVKDGMTVLDMGSGPGFFTVEISRRVGHRGLVYAVDADENSINLLKRKIESQSINNVIPILASVDKMDFIDDNSIDVVFSNKTLCCVRRHLDAAKEIKRVLKREGVAYVSISRPALDTISVNSEEWAAILSMFRIIKQGASLMSRWAILALPY
ncbi:hypothetical protein GCM10007981_15690 [Thermocladium modestius]|uniref:Methyltransferase domain-containing protein n=2 Tax=Thermocladium modestius TaxID=62609 RepID=A0A830GXM4_9CREN|nr:hypothetical protein GCM10007981_15690 [Thermocladium modestius]